MSDPLVIAVMLTYGRVKHLQTALSCFLTQTYANRRLIIFNSFPRQRLVFEHPLVQIINCAQRPPSLADARNAAIEQAPEDAIITTTDDDDLTLPNYCEQVGRAFERNSEAEWIRITPVFYAEKGKIAKTFDLWANSVAFRKSAWRKVGGYPARLNVGEDRAIVNKLSQQCRGVVIDLHPEDISAIYCWGNGAYHISGQGDDVPGKISSYDRSRYDLEARIRAGKEGTGTIRLEPKPICDAQKMREDYLRPGARPAVDLSRATCIIELGRYGDILNALPIAHQHFLRTGEKPFFMVAREFSDILEGVSYVQPHLYPGSYAALVDAVRLAEKTYGKVIRAQVYGRNHVQQRLTESYNKESWREAGCLDHFHDPAWKLVLDRRDPAREAAVARKLFVSKRPKVIASITCGASSPFSGGQKILMDLQHRLARTHDVIDVCKLRLTRFYDLLGIMERSALLVTADTAPLHLAAACQIPVIALVNEQPWLGTVPRCNCLARIPYTQATPEEVWQRVAAALGLPCDVSSRKAPPTRRLESPPGATRIFHCVERHNEFNPPDKQRKTVAWKSWDDLYVQGIVVPCHYWKYARDARQIGDKRPLPFLKDVMKAGMDQAGPGDIILWTNDDILLHPTLPKALLDHISKHGACTSQRRDFGVLPPPGAPIEIFARGNRHMGRDLFAASKAWLEKHWDEIPDFILGASDFDLCLAALVRLEFGILTTRQNVEQILSPAELPPGYVAHQKHSAFWNRADNVNTAPSQMHNRRLFKAWAEKHLPTLKFTDQLCI